MVKLGRTNKGYSLIELLVFITIISITFVAVIGALTYGIYAQTNAKMRQNALHLNSEALEWLRAFKDECGYATLASTVGNTYCMDSLDYSNTICNSLESPGACVNTYVDSIFTRQFTFEQKVDPNPTIAPNTVVADDVYISVTATTTWPMGTSTNSVTSTTYFSNYQ